MISVNFVAAVVTVVLRSLVDKFLYGVPAPKPSIIPSYTGTVLLSGTLYLLYNYLRKGCKVKVSYRNPAIKRKVIDGRLHKSRCEERLPHSHPRKSHERERCRSNLLQAVQDSVQILKNDRSSTCSTSDVSPSCSCNSENEGNRSRERSPSVFSIKSEEDSLTVNENKDHFKGSGDHELEDNSQNRGTRNPIKKKTRSGKVYSCL